MCPRLPSWRGPGTPRPPRRARFCLAIRGATRRGPFVAPGAFTTVSSVPGTASGPRVCRGAPWAAHGPSQPGRGAGPGGAVSPRTAPHSCGGQWSRPAFRRACHGQRVPGTPFTTRASWDLGLKGSGQLPWPCMVQMLTRERSRGGPEWRGRDPAGQGGRAALPDSHPGRVQTLLDWVSGWLGSPRLLCLCTPSHRPSGSGLHCRLHSGRGGGRLGFSSGEPGRPPL